MGNRTRKKGGNGGWGITTSKCGLGAKMSTNRKEASQEARCSKTLYAFANTIKAER
jgi:hypothetical protein